ncbi:MAG TPA: ArsR family transcriptional regulator [Candidatus Nanoarchaeia archaeon]|nr:ArsR family transcriptional regulator [Candidatus Nanoarchaeia archaeon]
MVQFNYQRITIIRMQRPTSHTLNEDLKWFGRSLGLFGIRDRDKSKYRIFVELLKSSRQGKALTSDELAVKLGLSRGTVVHHLNSLMETGIVMNQKNQYAIRVDNLKVLVDELQRDLVRAFDDLREVAQTIDKELGI